LNDLEYTLGVVCLQGAEKAKRPPSQCLMNIIDLKGIGWEARHFLGYFQKISQCDEQYYPCVMQLTWIINAPYFFPYLFSVCKPFLDPYTADRLKVFSDDSYKADLLKECDADQLPAEFGGSCKEHEGKCLPVLPKIDWAALDLKKSEEASKRMKLMDAEIPAGEIRIIQRVIGAKDVKTEEALSFEVFFKTRNKDINFSIEFHALNGTKHVLIPVEQFQSQTVPVLKEVTINEPGTLRFIFDNSYSYFTPKYLTYGIAISTSLDGKERKDQGES